MRSVVVQVVLDLELTKRDHSLPKNGLCLGRLQPTSKPDTLGRLENATVFGPN